MAATPRAPAAGSVTSAGSWYRQENSYRSAPSSTATPSPVTSTQARAAELSPRRRPAPIPATPAMSATSRNGPGVQPPCSW